MKKLLLVFALVLAYTVSISNANASTGDKKDKKAQTEAAAKKTGGCSEAMKKECATEGKSCCGAKAEKKAEEKK